jgi:uncharacterized protein YjgD (DUF1641 family)
MSDNLISEQINEINRKLDLLIDEVTIQRQNREAVNDLIDDVAVIGKDVFKNMVTELDDAGIELDSEALRSMIYKLIRNIGNLSMILETLESLTDLTKDLTPIIKQIGLDGVNKFHELEQKGYFDVLNQLTTTVDSVLSRYSRQDLQKLSENLIPVTETLMIIADPRVLDKINSITTTLRDIKTEEIEEYSVWRMIKELRKPEVKKSIGFIMAFLSIINKNKVLNNKHF